MAGKRKAVVERGNANRVDWNSNLSESVRGAEKLLSDRCAPLSRGTEDICYRNRFLVLRLTDRQMADLQHNQRLAVWRREDGQRNCEWYFQRRWQMPVDGGQKKVKYASIGPRVICKFKGSSSNFHILKLKTGLTNATLAQWPSAHQTVLLNGDISRVDSDLLV